MVTAKDAQILMKLARSAIAGEKKGIKCPVSFSKKKAVFVTLLTYPDKQLRGCIGYLEPIYTLKDAVVNAAKAAAFEDPRFKKLEQKELDNIILEISLLSEPKQIKAKNMEERLKQIKEGDGLIIKKGSNTGLFLPQVWEQIKDKKLFLDNLCLKAGLFPGCWASDEVDILKFSVEALIEEKPKGKPKKVR